VTTEDKYACAELIQSWGLFRDQRRWAELLATFTPDGTIAVSWFRGPFADFVERCRTREAQVGRAKHLIQPSLVRVCGDHAVAETSVVILVRQDIEGIATDLTAHARFLDRLVKQGSTWQIAERSAIYERDRLDPVEPSLAFAAMIERADSARYPAPYRYMAFRIAAAGGTLAMPILCDGMAETDALRTRYATWLVEATPRDAKPS
jgi:hypothetical protein